MADADLAIVLAELRGTLARQKAHAEGALAQLAPEDWHVRIDADANSIAVLVRHMAGNMRSRWTGFLDTDGEKPDRDRDGEFSPTDLGERELRAEWEEGWSRTFGALDALAPADLRRTVTIRGEEMTALRAILRQIEHYGQHVGQIVQLARHRRGAAWRPLSTPARRRGPLT